MNLVLDDAEEVHLKTKKRRPLGMFIHEIRYYRKLTVNCQTDSEMHWVSRKVLRYWVSRKVLYYMKFWRHFNFGNLGIFLKMAKLKCSKIKCC